MLATEGAGILGMTLDAHDLATFVMVPHVLVTAGVVAAWLTATICFGGED
jgi:hypothetical protein